MKLIDVDSKATLEDFLTLKKKTELVQFLRKCNEQISGIKNELTHRQRCRDVSFKKQVR
jgi:DNA-binding FrmR family transcriptional regulator